MTTKKCVVLFFKEEVAYFVPSNYLQTELVRRASSHSSAGYKGERGEKEEKANPLNFFFTSRQPADDPLLAAMQQFFRINVALSRVSTTKQQVLSAFRNL